MKPMVYKIAMERMQILVDNAIANARTDPELSNVKLLLLVESVLNIKFECPTILEWFSVKNVNPLLLLELILEFVWTNICKVNQNFL